MISKFTAILMMVIGLVLCLPFIIYFMILGNKDPIGYIAVPLSVMMIGICPFVWGLIYCIADKYPDFKAINIRRTRTRTR